MKTGNAVDNWLRGVEPGPQNLGYIAREDGELVLTKYDDEAPFAVQLPRGPITLDDFARLRDEIAALERALGKG